MVKLNNINWLELIRKRIAQILLLLFIIFFTLQRPDAFLTVNNFLNIARQVSIMGIVALGMSFVMLTGGLDFSVGSMVAFTGIIAGLLIKNLGVAVPIAFLIGISGSVLVGLVNGLIGVRLNIPILVVTIAMQQILDGINVVLTGNTNIYGFAPEVKILGQGYFLHIPMPVILLAISALIVSFVLSKTYAGRYLFAVGGNQNVARLSGINVIRVRILASVVCGLLSGIAGVVMLSRTAAAGAQSGMGLEGDVITAAVLGGVSIMGGVGNTSGVITGVLLIGVLNNGLVMMNVDSNLQNIIKGVILLVAVSLDSISRMSKHKNIKIELSERKKGND